MPKLVFPNGIELHFETHEIGHIMGCLTNGEELFDDNVIPITKGQKTQIKKKQKKGFGIPTIGVRDILFRSRIEAKWAYMWEKLDINWEYEAEDMDYYIPDFSMSFDNFDSEIIVEIKSETEAKMLKNRELYYVKAKPALQNRPFLFVGSSIQIGPDKAFGFMYYNEEWHRAFIITDGKKYGIRIVAEKTGAIIRIFFHSNCESHLADPQELSSLWSKAINDSRWEPTND